MLKQDEPVVVDHITCVSDGSPYVVGFWYGSRGGGWLPWYWPDPESHERVWR